MGEKKKEHLKDPAVPSWTWGPKTDSEDFTGGTGP